jgi:toxin YoeB
MARRKIVWTKSANLERKAILSYWVERNLSKRYSIRLNEMIKETLKIASLYPESGRRTNEGNTRVKIIRDYLLFYDYNETEIIVLSIWDANRNYKSSPVDFKNP